MGPISAERGWVISGRLANRFGSRFGVNTKLLRGVIEPISMPNEYLNTVFIYKKEYTICMLSLQRETYPRG